MMFRRKSDQWTYTNRSRANIYSLNVSLEMKADGAVFVNIVEPAGRPVHLATGYVEMRLTHQKKTYRGHYRTPSGYVQTPWFRTIADAVYQVANLAIAEAKRRKLDS